MSISSLTKLISSIPDSQSARISITNTTGELLHLDCTYREGTAPGLILVFPPMGLPRNIEMSSSCLISIKARNEDTSPLVFNARIEKIIGDSTLELTAMSLMDPTKLRQYFRVAISAPVTISFEKENGEAAAGQYSLAGETLDLSGSGVLALFGEECQEKQRIKIDLNLPSPQAVISCMGHVVHARRVRRGRYHIALHFDDINNKQRDIILSNCLQEQRKQLNKGL
ncbi:MAG: PilZ domain-containing protein [Desulfocapsaceae bacterium]|nr:PilZ domain-containing protein [Desulfocapsaceae bacterium]